MRVFVVVFGLVVISALSAQSSAQQAWTKEERNALYDECIDYLRKYPNTNKEQRENLSLCYLDEITNKYPRDKYKEKIDIELKKIREATLAICSRNLGVTLSETAIEEPKKTEAPKPTNTVQNPNKLLPIRKEFLTGKWKDFKNEYWLFASGDCKVVADNGRRTMGTWDLSGNVLTLYRERNYKTLIEFKILELTSTKFSYRSTDRNSDVYEAKRVAGDTPEQRGIGE